MMTVRTLASLAALGALVLSGCAQTPGAMPGPVPAQQEEDHAAHHPQDAASSGLTAPATAPAAPGVARMDEHMKAMREMHEKMARAKTPEERQALMAESGRLMRECMAMMGDMGPGAMGGMGGMGGMGAMPGAPATHAELAARQQMLEKRMEMMHAMMQAMMERMSAQPPAGK